MHMQVVQALIEKGFIESGNGSPTDVWNSVILVCTFADRLEFPEEKGQLREELRTAFFRGRAGKCVVTGRNDYSELEKEITELSHYHMYHMHTSMHITQAITEPRQLDGGI